MTRLLSAVLIVAALASVDRPPADIAARAIAAIREGRDTEARALVADATAAIAKDPPASHWRAWQQIGLAHVMLGSVDEAARIFNTLLGAAAGRQEIADAALTGLGRAALAAHNPAAAIRHLEKSQAKDARQWLAVALMMESRGPSDEYVERAFTVAESTRLDHVADARSPAEIAAALRPGETVIAFLIGEQHAYAWAFDRDALIGYPLPSPSAIGEAVDRARAYADQKNREGLRRIADDLTPALLGPVTGRLPGVTRLIFVPDDRLRRLPFADLPFAGSEHVAISIIDNGPLTPAAIRDAAQHRQTGGRSIVTLTAGAGLLLAAAAGVSRLAKRRSRARS